MRDFDLIIFDCDGVLIESEAQAAQALAAAITAAGRAMVPFEAERLFSGCSQEETRALLAGMGLAADAILAEAEERLSALFAQGVQPVSGMEQLLSGLEVQICVASNSGMNRLSESLGRTRLAGFFGPHIYSADHVAEGKPAPDLALHCLTQIRVPAERAIFVDDNIHGIGCARAAGVLSIGFVGPSECRKGHAETLRRAGADHVVRGTGELRSLLSELLNPVAEISADHPLSPVI